MHAVKGNTGAHLNLLSGQHAGRVLVRARRLGWDGRVQSGKGGQLPEPSLDVPNRGNAQKSTHRVPVRYFHFGAVGLHSNVETKVYYRSLDVTGSDRSV